MKKLSPTQQEQTFMNVLLENRYLAQDIIARGGMGIVFSGTDTILNRKVAIKLLQASMNEEALIRFEREASVISSFSHPNLVQLFSHGTHDGFTYLVLEYVPGKALSDILAQGRLSVEATVELGICIAAALVEAHAGNVIHRDLKPGNILVQQKGERVNAKLVDFGVAYAVTDGTRLTSAGAICGTPGYIAPEQIDGIQITEKCDLYSLGIVLFECLTGKRAFMGNNPIAVLIRQTQHDAPSLKNYSSLEIPAKVERLVTVLMSRDPQQRPENAKEVLLTLRAVQKTIGHDSDTSRKTIPLQSISRRQVEQSLSMPIREGGGWDQLLGATPGVGENTAIDPQIYHPNPNLIDISFEFGNESLLTSKSTQETIQPKPASQRLQQKSPKSIPASEQARRSTEKAPISELDFSQLELEIVERNAPMKVRPPRSSMKPWLQFVIIALISMTVTLGLVYFFLERDNLTDHLPKTKKIPPFPKSGKKPSPPKQWKKIQGM